MRRRTWGEQGQPHRLWPLLWRGLWRRCPHCGARGLFTRWIRMEERCPGCGYRFERLQGFGLGSSTVNLGATMLAVLAVEVAGIALTVPEIPVLPLTVAGALVALVFPVVFYPNAQTFWAGIELYMRPLDRAELADAAAHVQTEPSPA